MDLIKTLPKAYLREQSEITKILGHFIKFLLWIWIRGFQKTTQKYRQPYSKPFSTVDNYVLQSLNTCLNHKTKIYFLRLFALPCFYFQLSSNNLYKRYILSHILVTRQVINGFRIKWTTISCNTIYLHRGFSPPANYTDWEGVAWSAQRIPTAVNFGFLDRSHYFSIQVAPKLSSRGWVDPVTDPLLLRKCGRAGNRTRDLNL
jgi:hypothetical protein